MERRSLVAALDTGRAQSYTATESARAATRREIDSLIRVHPYSDPTTAQSITAPSGYRASRIRCGVGFLFLPSSRRTGRVHANEAQVRPTLHVRSRNGVYVRHERTSTSISRSFSPCLPRSRTYVARHTQETFLLLTYGKRRNSVLRPDFRLQTGQLPSRHVRTYLLERDRS